MPKANDAMKEYSHRAEALAAWFESQDISQGEAVSTMCFLMGIMSANHAHIAGEKSTEQGLNRLRTATTLAIASFAAAFPLDD